MEQIVIEGKSGSSKILVGESLDAVGNYLPQSGVFIITDSNVDQLYRHRFPGFPVYVVQPGEQSKDYMVIARIWQWLLDQGADRGSFILAIGGGVVCDIAGFVAATFMRGVSSGFVATTLLAQVDASVGGKNGINLNGYKNIIGTFSQPSFVICDTSLLTSLSQEEFSNGMAEVIKHALIKDEQKFHFLQSHTPEIKNLDPSAIEYIVSRSVQIKAAVVQADEHERGERKLLNFGHTWGHAIEKVMKVPHGQAVALGMVFAAELSVRHGLLSESQKESIEHMLEKYNLPVSMAMDKEKIFEAMLRDKKRDNQIIHFILLENIGKAIIKATDVEVLKKFAL
jgi:3-dehydroquinate synthase